MRRRLPRYSLVLKVSENLRKVAPLTKISKTMMTTMAQILKAMTTMARISKAMTTMAQISKAMAQISKAMTTVAHISKAMMTMARISKARTEMMTMMARTDIPMKRSKEKIRLPMWMKIMMQKTSYT